VLGRMPAPQVIALLKASEPSQAAVTLLTFPVERIDALLALMQPADVAGMLAGSTAAQKRQLLAAMTTEKALLVLHELAAEHAANALAAMPAPRAASLLSAAPTRQARRILSELSETTRSEFGALMAPDRAAELFSAFYEQRVIDSVVRMTTAVSRLPCSTCDLMVAVLRRAIHVAVRYHGQAALVDHDIEAVATAADWNRIAGLVMVTDAELTDAALHYGYSVRSAGYAFELLRWTGERDDGALKRALVRLTG
jgi:hypothetical protein